MFPKIFPQSHNVIIGAIHLPPSPGYEGFPGLEKATSRALEDLKALEQGGVTAVIFENNYDVPHTEHVTPEATNFMRQIGEKLREKTSLPLGISVLWNDYRTALQLSKVLGLQFIRVPVFVDRVKTSYGVFEPQYKEVVACRKMLAADDVALLTDIHVKHAEILNKDSLVVSGERAILEGSDALIVTGKWTGDAPDLGDLEALRESVGAFPILCGSGVSSENARELFSIANGAIVSTSLKEGRGDVEHVNVKPYEARISLEEVKKLAASI